LSNYYQASAGDRARRRPPNFASSDPHPSPPTPPTARCVSRPVTAPLCRSCRRGWASRCRA